MKPSILSAEEAVLGLADGALIGIGGSILNRKPMALVQALAAAGRVIDVVTFLASTDAEALAAAGVLRRLTAAYCGLGGARRCPSVTAAIEAGSTEWDESTEWLVVNGFRAAAMGLPFLPSRTRLSGDLPASRRLRTVTDPYGGAILAAHPAIRPDLALIHAWRADEEGNVQLPFPPDHLWDVDLQLARAARRTIVSVEEIVPRAEIQRTSHLTRLTRIEVAALVLAPGGARPTACRPAYEADADALDALAVLRVGEAHRHD